MIWLFVNIVIGFFALSGLVTLLALLYIGWTIAQLRIVEKKLARQKAEQEAEAELRRAGFR